MSSGLLWVTDRRCLSCVCTGSTCDLCVLLFGQSNIRCALFHCNLPSGQAQFSCALAQCNLPSRDSESSVLCPSALQLLTRSLCQVQFSTAAVHAAEEQREAASKEAKRQELFPSLSCSSSATRPAQSTGESSPSVMTLPGCGWHPLHTSDASCISSIQVPHHISPSLHKFLLIRVPYYVTPIYEFWSYVTSNED